MDRLINAFKSCAGALDGAQGQARFGIVASVDPNRATARVLLQPEGVLSGWLPVLSAWVGSGWGMVCPPNPGDQVLVLAQEGAAEHGVIVGRAFSDQQSPPAAPGGEMWLVHASGSAIKLVSDGTVQVTGDLHVAGDVYDRYGPLSGLRAVYNQHTHTDSHNDVTGQPNPQD